MNKECASHILCARAVLRSNNIPCRELRIFTECFKFIGLSYELKKEFAEANSFLLHK